MQLTRIECVYFALLFLLLLGIFALNMIAVGTLTSPRTLAIDLAAPPESPQDWTVKHWTPTKYRALFRWIVEGTWSNLFPPDDAFSFYLIFIFWSFVFFYLAIIALYFYLKVLDFDRVASFVGCLLFLLSPPVILAYKYPVFTREDPLAYLLVVLGLIATFKSKPVWVSGIAALGALTRETTLLIPFVYLIAANDTLWRKILVCIPPIVTTVGIRLLLGFQTYDPFSGSIYNIETPWQTIAFVFMIFGFLWLPYLIKLRECRRRSEFSTHAWKVLAASGPACLALVLGTHLILARAREIRISFLLFPWAIPLALDWFRNNVEQLKMLLTNRLYAAIAISIFVSISFTILLLKLVQPALMKNLADFNNGYWLVLGDIHLSTALALSLPILHRPVTVRSA